MVSEFEQSSLTDIGRNYYHASCAIMGKKTYHPAGISEIGRTSDGRVRWRSSSGGGPIISGPNLLVRLMELVPYAGPNPEISRLNCVAVTKLGSVALKQINKLASSQSLDPQPLTDIQDYLGVIHGDVDETFRTVIDPTDPLPADLKALAYLEANATLLNQPPINKV